MLLVDCDPQCNSTQLVFDEDITRQLYLKKDKPFKHSSILDVVQPIQDGDASISQDIRPALASQNRFGVDVVVGHPRLSIVEDTLSQAWNATTGGDIGGIRKTNWCTFLCRELEKRYDLVFFDIGPSLGSLNRTVLLGTQFFITPMGCDLFSIFGIRNIADWLEQWLKLYENALNLCAERHPKALERYKVPPEPLVASGFAGYTVQQYITKSKAGIRRPTKAFEQLLESIPAEVETSLKKFFAPGITPSNIKLGDVPHMYSLVPLAQSVNAPIRGLRGTDGLVGTQFKQAASYTANLERVVRVLANNIGLKVK